MKETDSIFIARFLAILGVITVHVSMNINNHHSELNFLFYKTLCLGAYGVHFFFLISGYCLAASYYNRKENTFKYFFIRRFLRIAPLYFLIGIIFYFIIRFVKYYYFNETFYIDNNLPYSSSLSIYNFKNIASNILFIHGFVESANTIVPGGWSIANEMFYYLLFPFLLRFLSPNSLINNLKFFFLLVLGLYLMNLITTSNLDKLELIQYLEFVFRKTIHPIIYFVIGMIIYYDKNLFFNNITKPVLLILFALVILLILFYIYKIKIVAHLSLICLFILIIIFLNKKKTCGFFSKILINYGKASYSAYLVHYFFVDIVSHFLIQKYLLSFNNYLCLFIYLIIVLFLTYIVSRLINLTLERWFIEYGKNLIYRMKQKTT